MARSSNEHDGPTGVNPAEETGEDAARADETANNSELEQDAESEAPTDETEESAAEEDGEEADGDADEETEEDDGEEGGEEEPGSGKWHRRVRVPTVLQMEAVECGAASLAMVLAHFGRWVPLEQLRADCGVSRDGSNAANVLAAGEGHGLEGTGYRMEIEGFAGTKFPCILFWNFNHFLVLEGFSRNRKKVYLNDPASGRRVLSMEEFDKGFSGVVITFTPGPTFEKGGRKPSIIAGLAQRVRGMRIAVSYVILAGLGLVIPGLAIPTFTKVFVDDILIGGSKNWLGPLLVGMAVAAMLRAGLTALQAHYLMRAQMKMAIATTGRFLWHVLRLPIEFFMHRYAADISARISSNDRVAQVLTGDLATNVIGVVTAAFFVFLMWRYDPTLTMIGVSLAVVNLLLLRFIARTRADESQKMLQENGKLMSTAMTGVQGIETIKATARESDFFARWAGYQAKSAMAEQRLAVSSTVLNVVPPTLAALSSALVLGLGGWRVMDGTMSIGMLVAFQSLLNSFSHPIEDFVRLGDVVQRLGGDMKRLDDVTNYHIDHVFARDEEDEKAEGPVKRLTGFVELRNVCFGYSRLDEPLIKDFSLSLSPGDRVAIVGGSGSGKSTIAKLLAGVYRPWSGDILFDNRPRDSVPRAQLANSFAMVDQDIFFFEGSIRENIALWDSTLPDEAIQRACKDACIHDDIASRRGGYASEVEEDGRNFSGGQRQRMEIARALVNDPTILVLDEATSALDAATEKLVDDHIRRRGCTCVIVAHRLSTIRDANEIIVLDRGVVVQRGTHDELMMDENGRYARLIRSE
ncbi:MAG: NHLP family bacteriocin export ABC transporter peptidase/permease/ATPase subunit [Phycisphaeraceae bacterium]|nr:NHLP family bacteriocin export ABC transporter peptidase/permease/ATPase subunit [Phycisphaeraceae bacterium]